VHKPRSAG